MKIELIKPHNHNGKNYAPGSVLEVREGLGGALIKMGVAKAEKNSAPVVLPDLPKPKAKGTDTKDETTK